MSLEKLGALAENQQMMGLRTNGTVLNIARPMIGLIFLINDLTFRIVSLPSNSRLGRICENSQKSI